jgi:hypothetical protein
VDPAKAREIGKALDALEEKLLNRIPRAAERSPETLSEEAFNEVLELKMKLSLAWSTAAPMLMGPW